MLLLTMHRPEPRVPGLITITAAVLICIAVVFVNISAQSPTSDDALSVSREVFSWVIAAAGVITLIIGIGYGFVKKQKYENLQADRDEWKGLAESREERIKEMVYTHSESEAKLQLKIKERDGDITNLRESNSALVSQGLQMKGILRKLRIEGVWHGHEEEIHRTEA